MTREEAIEAAGRALAQAVAARDRADLVRRIRQTMTDPTTRTADRETVSAA